RPVDRQREADQQEVADQVEQRQEVHPLQEQAVKGDHDEVRQVLVVEELREAQVQLRAPVVERVLAARQRLARPLDQEIVEGVVVETGDRDGQLGPERDRVEDG